MMLSVVQFDSIVQFDQFDWPYLILVPGPLGGFGAFLLWFLLYVRSWCLSSRSRVLKEYLDGWTFLSSRRSALMPDWILILALARMSRSEDAALRRFGRQMRCLVPLFWCNVLIAVGFLLPLYGVGVIVFVRQLLLDAGRTDDVHVILLFKDEPLERMNVVSTYRTTTPQIARASRRCPFPNRTSFFTTLTITCTGFQGSISFLVT